jgi:hypothetical protein
MRFLSLILLLVPFQAYSGLRADFNGLYGSFLKGDCKSIEANKACILEEKSDSLNGLVKGMNHIALSEANFFQTAARNQADYLRCDRSKLQSMALRNPQSMNFQRTVMLDLAMKLPELRIHYKKSSEAAAALSELQKEVDAIYANIGRSMDQIRTAQPRIDKLKKKIQVQMAILTPEAALFNTIYSSLWRSDDPNMEAFVMRAIGSPKPAMVLAKEALREDADNGLLDYKMVLGDKLGIGESEFSFQEQVLTPMIKQNEKDLTSLDSQSADGHSKKFSSDSLSFSTKRMLVKDSEWASSLIHGNPQSAVFMCELDNRYVSGDSATITTLEVGSLFISGGGALAEMFAVSKFARLINPTIVKGVMLGSQAFSVASVFMGTVASAKLIQEECFASRPLASFAGKNQCSENEMKTFDEIEKIKLERENCALAVITGVANGIQLKALAQHTLESEFVKKLSRYRGPAKVDEPKKTFLKAEEKAN